MKKAILSWAAPVFLALVAVIIHQGPVVAEKDLIYQHAAIEAKVRSLIQRKFYKKIDETKLHHGAIQGMVSTLDDYSAFIPPQKVKDFDQDTTGKFGGLGIIIEMRDGYLTVVTPLEGTPAHKAGVRAGDKILRVKYEKDGEWVERSGKFKNTEEARKVLMGKEGTSVILTVRHESGDVESVKVTRAIITIKSVKGTRMLDSRYGIGYIRISSFQENTNTEFTNALAELKKQGMRSLVLDLRFNPGGLLDQAISISDHFLSEGIIVQTKGRVEGQNKPFYATSGGSALDINQVIILINKGSASASEIVAGALRDHKKALLIGERSWGKGSVQTIIELKEGRDKEGRPITSKLKLTTAIYLTPNGKQLHREVKNGKKISGGLEPDVYIPSKPGEDLLLVRARQEQEILREKQKVGGGLVVEKKVDRNALEKKFREDLHRLDSLHRIEWRRIRLQHDLFVDRSLLKSISILKDPRKYNKLMEK